MRHISIPGIVTMAVAASIAFAGTASATMLYKNPAHTETLGVGAELHAEAESEIILDADIGDIKCKAGSIIAGSITNAGGAGVGVKVSIPKASLTWKECNATVNTIAGGELEVNWTNGTEASLKWTGAEITVEFLGEHCIYVTNNTPIGTITASAHTGKTATYDIEATLPRNGGRSGAFCGTTGDLTASYSVSSPDFLNATNS